MVEYGTIAAIIGILGFLITVIGAVIKIFVYFRGEITKLQNEVQKDIIKISEDNSEFRLTAQKEIADLALKIEREFVRKNP